MGDDGNFRPVDVQIAPDGSLYIIDWHNALIGHLQHNLREPNRDHSHGRIWRLKHKTRPLLKPAKIDGQPIAALLELLKVPEDRTRYRAKRELAARDTGDVLAALETWIGNLDPADEDYEHHLLESLWIYQTHNVVNEELLETLLTANDHRARAAATRVLSFWLQEIPNHHELLQRCIDDEHPRVRLEGVRAVSFLRGDDAIELALGVLEHDMDDDLQYTLDETMRRLEQ
jgi:sugar lactone lactonase YvrE